MHRLIIRISAALITFTLGVGGVAIYRLNEATPTIPVVEQHVEVTIIPFPAVCYPGRSVPTNAMAKGLYFPPKVFSENDWGDESYANWFSSHLRAMNEEPLHVWDDGATESYRFLWLRSFHHPVAVNIWSCGSERFIAVKEMSGAGGYEPGNLILHQQRTLTTDEWNHFIRLFDNTCFWQLPTPNAILGNDGAQWIFEAVKRGRYHVVDRWSPRGGSYRELCLYMLELSGLKVDTAIEPLY